MPTPETVSSGRAKDQSAGASSASHHRRADPWRTVYLMPTHFATLGSMNCTMTGPGIRRYSIRNGVQCIFAILHGSAADALVHFVAKSRDSLHHRCSHTLRDGSPPGLTYKQGRLDSPITRGHYGGADPRRGWRCEEISPSARDSRFQ